MQTNALIQEALENLACLDDFTKWVIFLMAISQSISLQLLIFAIAMEEVVSISQLYLSGV